MATERINDTEIFYKQVGEGPSTLLIHGTGADADCWGECFDRLAEDHRVIAYDRRGYSRSRAQPVRDYRQHARDAAALLERLGASQAIVAGWSSGGVVALDLAGSRPDLVSALVLVEPPLRGQLPPTRSLIAAYLRLQLGRLRGDRRAAAEEFFCWVFRYSTGEDGFRRLPAARREAMLANAGAVVAEFDPSLHSGMGEYLSRRRLAAIACPVRYLLGEHSEPLFHRSARRFAALVQQTRFEVVRGVAHGLHFEAPDAFVRAIHEARTGCD